MNRPLDDKATDHSEHDSENRSRNTRIAGIVYLLVGTAVVIASVGLALYAGSVQANVQPADAAPVPTWSTFVVLAVSATIMATIMTTLRAGATQARPDTASATPTETPPVTTVEKRAERGPAQPAEQAATMDFDTFRDSLPGHWRNCRRQSCHLAMLTAKIDNFRELADIFGHFGLAARAEQMTVSLESLVRANGGQLARNRRDEVVALIPNASPDHALKVAEDIRTSVEDLGFEIPGNGRGVITVSVGLSVLVPSEGTSPDQLVESARHALDRARARGGNRVEFEMPELRQLQSSR